MKTTGIVILILGLISLLGCIIGGDSVLDPLFWVGLGIFLIHRANQKKQEKKEKEEWSYKDERNDG